MSGLYRLLKTRNGIKKSPIPWIRLNVRR